MMDVTTTTGESVTADFASFARQRGGAMLRTAWLITRHSEDAKDAVQDALVGLFRSWSRVREADDQDAYVRRAVVNASLKICARRRASSPITDAQGSVPDHAASIVEADTLWRRCGELSPDQRAAVVLRFYHDLDFAAVAAALGCREATARSHIHRALARLRASLEGEAS